MDQLKKRSSFISYLALFSIVIALFMIYESVSNMVLLNSMNNSPEYRIAEEMMPSLKISPMETFVEITMQIVGIIASIGLFMRLNWGRILFMIVLSMMTIWGIVSSIQSYLSLSQYFKGYQLGSSLELVILGALVAVGVNIYLLWKLSTKEVREECSQQASMM